MGSTQSLAIVVLSTQFVALVMMIIMLSLDSETFEKMGKGRWVVLPGLVKVTHLFRQTPKPLFMGFYFLIMAFILFSYAALVILIVDFAHKLLFPNG